MLGFLILYFIFLGILLTFLFSFLAFKIMEYPVIRLQESPNAGFIIFSGILAFFSIITIVLGGKIGIPVLFIVLLSLFLFMLVKKHEIKNAHREREKRIRVLENRLNQSPNDFGVLMALGKLFEETGDNNKALKYYEMAHRVIGFAEESLARRKVAEIKYAIKKEEEERPVVCPRCGTRNLSNAVLCRRCYKVLKSPIYVWREMNRYAKALIVILGFQYVIFAIVFSITANLVLWFFTLIDILLFYRMFREV